MQDCKLFKTIGEFDPEFKVSELCLDEEKARWLNTILTKDYENITREMADYFGNDEIIKEVEEYRREKCKKKIEDFFDRLIDSANYKERKVFILELCYTSLSEGFIEKYIMIFIKHWKNIPKNFWKNLFRNPNISEAFVERYLKGEFGNVYNDEDIWESIWRKPNISESFIEKHISKIQWNVIVENLSVSEAFFERHMDEINKKRESRMLLFKTIWANLSYNTSMSEAFFEKHLDCVNWYWLCGNTSISEAFFERHWKCICDTENYLVVIAKKLAENTNLSEEFFKRHGIVNTNFSESFLISFLETEISKGDIINYSIFFSNPKLSEACIEKYIEEIENIENNYTFWYNVCRNTGLSEGFFDKYIAKGCHVDWTELCINTSMSEAFFERHLDKFYLQVDWHILLGNSNMSPEFFEKRIRAESKLGYDDRLQNGYFCWRNNWDEFRALFGNTFERYIERQSKLTLLPTGN